MIVKLSDVNLYEFLGITYSLIWLICPQFTSWQKNSPKTPSGALPSTGGQEIHLSLRLHTK